MRAKLFSGLSLLAISAGALEAQTPLQRSETAAPVSRSSIEVSTIDAVDPFAVGTLNRSNGALAPDLWLGTDADIALALLSRVEAPARSVALARLMRRALASGGNPPEGGRGRPDLLQARLQALLAAGLRDDAKEIIERTPGWPDNPDLILTLTELLLAEGNTDRACALQGELANTAPDESQLLRAVCYAIAGEPRAAELAAEFAINSGVADADFFTVIAAATGAGGRVKPRNAYELAVVLAPDAEPTDWSFDPFGDTPVWLVDSLTITDRFPANVRRDLAWSAALAGRLAPDQIAEAWLAPERARDPEAEVPPARSDAERAARLLDAVTRAEQPDMKARALARFLRLGKTMDSYLALARLAHVEIRYLPPTPDAIDRAVELAEAAIAVGDLRLAQEWRRVEGARGQGADLELDALFAAADPAFDLRDAGQLAALRLEQGGPSAQTDVMLLVALGAKVPPRVREDLRTLELADEGAPLPAGDLAAIQLAAESNAKAEVLLRIVESVGDRTLADIDLASLSRILHSLRYCGLESAARELAVERMIAARLDDPSSRLRRQLDAPVEEEPENLPPEPEPSPQPIGQPMP